MKPITIRATKGESLVFVELSGADAAGHRTEDEQSTTMWVVSLGGNCGMHHHRDKGSAASEFRTRVGYLVENGYCAERVAD